MNLQSVFEELDKLYENVEEPVEEQKAVEQEESAEELTEAVEDDATMEEPEDTDEVVELNLVLECANCGALVIKPEADVAIDEKSDIVNVEDACQYCEATDGYKIIGTLAPYAAEEEIEVVDNEEAEAEEEVEDEVVEEGLLDVDLPISVDVKADNNNVSVGTLG